MKINEIRKRYKIHIKIRGRVRVKEEAHIRQEWHRKEGKVLSTEQGMINVLLDGDPIRHRFHPHDLDYLD
jgi:hypothetical protein